MEYPFDELNAGIESQIMNLPAGIPDSLAVLQAKALPDSVEKFCALGKAFSRQLRYREAIDAYTDGLKLEPENLPLLRLRAGRYLTTLQSNLAITDFEKCLSLGAEKLDCLYRIGLAYYYAGRYAQAMETFENCMPLCDEEMGIAVIYWHTLSAVRAGKAPTLLNDYHTGMAVGHHTAYEKSMQVWSGATSLSAMLQMLESEKDDLEYGIVLYGLLWHPDCDEQEYLYEKLLSRDGFWPSFAYLAAWRDSTAIR